LGRRKTVKGNAGKAGWVQHASVPRVGSFCSPGAASAVPSPWGVSRDTGLDVDDCGRGQGVAPTCRAAGCGPPLSRCTLPSGLDRGPGSGGCL